MTSLFINERRGWLEYGNTEKKQREETRQKLGQMQLQSQAMPRIPGNYYKMEEARKDSSLYGSADSLILQF